MRLHYVTCCTACCLRALCGLGVRVILCCVNRGKNKFVWCLEGVAEQKRVSSKENIPKGKCAKKHWFLVIVCFRERSRKLYKNLMAPHGISRGAGKSDPPPTDMTCHPPRSAWRWRQRRTLAFGGQISLLSFIVVLLCAKCRLLVFVFAVVKCECGLLFSLQWGRCWQR